MYTVLVCWRDFSPDGRTAGPGTKARVRAGVAWARAQLTPTVQVQFVTVGGVSPHPDVIQQPIAALMANELRTQWLGPLTIISSETKWVTDSEITVFLTTLIDQHQPVIVSAAYHIPRIFLIVWQRKGWRFARSVAYVHTHDDPITLTKIVLEVCKCIYYLLPTFFQRIIYTLYIRFGLWIDRTH